MELNIDTITFGKYRNKSLKDMLKDRKYCKWFLSEPEFKIKYEYIYNKVKEFEPQIHFLPIDELITGNSFLERYVYFNLTPIDKLTINLTGNEKKCYTFYLNIIDELKTKIADRVNDLVDNPYDIKAPVKWLQRFETETGLKRDEFKEFINSYDLPNLPYIIEDIKKEGGIVYKGANSFLIAKERSQEQEKYWETILKTKHGEDLGVQYMYENCIFDFINITSSTLYECKLGMKDFNEEQYVKYNLILNKYKIIYLIDRDCVIDVQNKTIYTLDDDKYITYQIKIPLMKKPSKFDDIILDFKIIKIESLINHI